MPWISDEILALYRTMDASLRTVSQSVQNIEREMRRLERRMDAMARTTQESLEAVRETAGFVASLAKLVTELRDKVTEVTSNAGLSADDQAKVDAIFDEAHVASAAAASALTQNQKAGDTVASPATTPPAADPAPTT
jgi:septal ring factor EnvC (AmiA/AmiB activator)